MIKPAAFCYGCFLLVIFQPIFAEKASFTLESRIQEVFQQHSESVVRVKATSESQVGDKVRRLLKIGSGFFVSKEGHILTTGLLPNAERIWVEFKNTYLLAEEIGHDPLCNLSLLKLLEPPSPLKYVKIGNFTENTNFGTFIVGITCALEFEIGPTHGLAQSYEFSFGKRLFPTKMLRSNLALGPGEVGAPVFDLNGRFVGITHAALPDLRSSFILPTKACKRIRDDLLLSGEVEYGWFGITTARKLNELNAFNIVIHGFIDGSPDEKSNLQTGDILLQVGEQLIRTQGDLANASFFAQPNVVLDFKIKRREEELIVPVRVARRPKIANPTRVSLVESSSKLETNSSDSSLNPSKEKTTSKNF